MKYFPTICVDNFYRNPDKVREFALSLDYSNEYNSSGDYPGKRTELLHLVDPVFFDDFCNKLFSLYFDFLTPVKWTVKTSFQLIHPLADSEQDKRNHGWIHRDNNVLFAGVIYLTPNINPNCGTSIFKETGKIDESLRIEANEYKKRFYTSGDTDHHDKYIDINNKQFTETARFDNIYNRLVSFDGETYHAANNFYTDGEPRLTQTFFIEKIEASSSLPLERCYNNVR